MLTGSGEGVLLIALLAVAGTGAGPALVAAGSVLAVAIRWGTTSLSSVAGAQAILGPAAVVGPAPAAAACVTAAMALVLAAPGRLAAPVFGLTAGAFLAGPGGSAGADVATRAASMLLGTVLAVVLDALLPRRSAGVAAVGIAAGAVVLALAG